MRPTAYAMIVLLTLIPACGLCAGQQPVEPAAQPLTLTQAALFKNGFGFFVGQAPLPADATTLRFRLPVMPSQGTFWLSYPPQVTLVSAIAEKARAPGESREAITIPEILKANVGRQVRITIGEKLVSGRIAYVTEDHRMLRPVAEPRTMMQVDIGQPEIWPPFDQGLVILDAEEGTVSLDPRSVEQVLFVDGPVRRTFAHTMETIEVRVQTEKPLKGRSLIVSFLARGIAWTPSYLADISEEKKARLSAKALIINEVYDLDDVAVQLVTGFPRLEYSDILSPISMQQPLAQFLDALAGREHRQVAVMQSYAMARGAEMAAMAPDVAPDYGRPEPGVTAEDLFLYPAGRTTLARDRVAYVPLFTQAVPYEHLYQWKIPDTTTDAPQFRPEPGPPEDEKEEEVWHSIRLENTTKVPWTPAPVEVVERGMILGQDTIRYTPVGGEVTVRIGRAADIRAEQRELEIERQREARQLYGVFYDLVTLRGELTVTNFRDEPVTLEIVKTLSGEVRATDPEAKIEQLAAGLQRMNPLNELTWQIRIEPTEKQQVTYTYQTYIRR